MQIQALMICVFFFFHSFTASRSPATTKESDETLQRAIGNLEDLVEGLGDGVLERGAVGLEEEVLVNVETGEADADELEEIGHCKR